MTITRNCNFIVNGKTINVTEEYEDYDPRFCCNGGSYYQPHYKAECPELGETLYIEDTSCGDFGSRVHARLAKGDETIAEAQYGSMIEDENWYSTFTEDNLFWIEVGRNLGYNYCREIPYY